jgi:rubrerythrin
MLIEQKTGLAALKVAIDMEQADKEFYLQASRESCNEVGRKLLNSLALEESDHNLKLVEIYRQIEKTQRWPAVDFPADRVIKLRESFDAACQLTGVAIKPGAVDFDAINTAIDREKKSYDFYIKQSQKAAFDSERDLYKNIAGEERQHELVLLNYNEYLTDPVDWLTRTEHHSLDGG